MAPMSCPEPGAVELTDADRAALLRVAGWSIQHGLRHRQALSVNPLDYSPALRERRATFVTLHLAGQLRGCIGTLEATRPLVEDVAYHAHAAAFHDPRFDPVTADEAHRLEIDISILSPPRPLACASEEDLLEQLVPGVHGVILEDGDRRATFLPAVWQTLPDKRQFLDHLRAKAGLPARHWSDTTRVLLYTAQTVK